MKGDLHGNGVFTRANTNLETPDVLMQAIKDLIPEIIAHPSLILKMHRAIFLQPKKSFSSQLREISCELNAIVKPENRENLDYFMAALKGMQIMTRENGLNSPSELSAYIENELIEVKQSFSKVKGFQDDDSESFRKTVAKGKGGASRSDMV